MARTLTWRRRAGAGALVALAALGLAACAKTANSPAGTPGTTSSGNGSLGDAPTTGAPSGGPTSPGGGGGGGGGTSSPLYPPDARSYGLEVIKAWMNKDFDRLATLAEQAGVQQIKDSITYGGLPDTHWTYISCGPGDTTDLTNCVYRNSHGDESVIAMRKANLGHPIAATQASLDRTTYPDDAGAYVSAMMEAFGHGNMQRVLRLSNSTVKSMLKCTINGNRTDITTSGGSTVTVEYSGRGGNAGSPDYSKTYTFTVLAQPGGKANAIKSVSNIVCT